MPNTTPTGWRCAIARLPGISDGTTSPETCVVIEAASRSIEAAKCTLKCPQPAVEPVSSRTAAAKSAARASRSSAALMSLARRAPGPRLLQAGKAACAAATAASASSVDAAAARVTTFPVTGLRRSKVAPPRAACSLPPINRFTSYIANSLVARITVAPKCALVRSLPIEFNLMDSRSPAMPCGRE